MRAPLSSSSTCLHSPWATGTAAAPPAAAASGHMHKPAPVVSSLGRLGALAAASWLLSSSWVSPVAPPNCMSRAQRCFSCSPSMAPAGEVMPWVRSEGQ